MCLINFKLLATLYFVIKRRKLLCCQRSSHSSIEKIVGDMQVEKLWFSLTNKGKYSGMFCEEKRKKKRKTFLPQHTEEKYFGGKFINLGYFLHSSHLYNNLIMLNISWESRTLRGLEKLNVEVKCDSPT